MPAPRTYRLQARPRHLVLAGLIALLVAANYLVHREQAVLATIEGQTLNWRFQIRGPVVPPEDIVIVAIDDATIAAVGSWPLPRSELAATLRRLDAAGASAIAFDLLFTERRPVRGDGDPPPEDQSMVEAFADSSRAVLPLAFTFDPRPRNAPPPPPAPKAVRDAALKAFGTTDPNAPLPLELQATGVLAPLAALRGTAELGHVNVVLDPDGALRLFHPLVEYNNDIYPALPLVAIRVARDLPEEALTAVLGETVQLGETRLATDHDGTMPLNFYGPRGAIPTYSMIDLLEERLDPAIFAERIVLIGSTGTGLGDTFQTPFARLLPGVEAFATATANIVDGTFLARGPGVAAIDIAAILICGLLAGLLGWIRLPVLAFVAALALMAGWLAVASIAFSFADIWLNVAFPALAIMLNAIIVGVRWAAVEYRAYREGERQRSNLARYVPERLADVLATEETPAFDNRAQPAAILFVDLAGFTGLSEELGPEATVAMLREFHGRVEAIVVTHDGTVEKFMGDGAMIIFGVPEANPADAPNALACARALVSEISIWSAEASAPLRGRLRLCAGITYGEVMIARLGSARHLQLTATGDTVNVASRLEALTREHDAAIAVSSSLIEAVRAANRDDLIADFAPLPAQPIRGRRDLQDIFVLPRTAAEATM